MRFPVSLTGLLVSGKGEGAFFTQLDWFQGQCRKKLGFIPFPGTLNVHISAGDISRINAIEKIRGIIFIPPEKRWCSAQAFPAVLYGIEAAILFPEMGVRIHGNDILEIIAPVGLKETLKIKDGDRINFEIKKP